MTVIDPVACAALFVLAFVLAGVAQTAWFASHRSRALALPLDGGLTFRGRRLFGANKTVRGLVVMVPGVAAALPLVAATLEGALPAPAGLWPLTMAGYAGLGAWSALGFMLGELPNSFVKRQLGIAPGGTAPPRLRPWQIAADRLDSAVGMLAAASLVVHVPWATWALVLAVGPIVHGGFSFLLFRLGLKT